MIDVYKDVNCEILLQIILNLKLILRFVREMEV